MGSWETVSTYLPENNEKVKQEIAKVHIKDSEEYGFKVKYNEKDSIEKGIPIYDVKVLKKTELSNGGGAGDSGGSGGGHGGS